MGRLTTPHLCIKSPALDLLLETSNGHYTPRQKAILGLLLSERDVTTELLAAIIYPPGQQPANAKIVAAGAMLLLRKIASLYNERWTINFGGSLGRGGRVYNIVATRRTYPKSKGDLFTDLGQRVEA